MALISLINRTCISLCPSAATKLCRYFCHHEINKAISLDVDVLDDFTSQLMQKKTDKWGIQKVKAQKLIHENNSNKKSLHDKVVDIKELSTDNLNVLFQNAIDFGNEFVLVELTNQCIKYKKCPSLSIVLHILSIYSQKGDKTTIRNIEQLCQEVEPRILQDNSNFDHYLAEAIWVKGNVVESLKLFNKVYRQNAFLRRRIRLMLKYLISQVVFSRSEAALINIIRFSETLVQDYQDYFPLICTWEACFLSEWFTDHCIAFEILEKNEGLCKLIINRIPYVVSTSLRSHRTEVVYRLLEILLRYEMKPQYSGVLLALLEYQFKVSDLRSCLEIIQWSVKHDVNLPSIHHAKFIKILIKNNLQVPNKLKPKPHPVPPNFKF